MLQSISISPFSLLPRIFFLFPLLIPFFLSSCTTLSTPQAVTDKFWQSIINKNYQKAANLSVNKTLPPGYQNLEIKDFKIDSVRIEDDQAKIDTLIWLNTSGQSKEILLITHLNQVDTQWFVDAEKTIDSRLSGSLHKLFKSLEEVKEGFIDSLNKSAGDLENQIPEIENNLESFGKEMINEFDNIIDDILPKIQSAIEENLDKLDDSIKELEKKIPETSPREKGNNAI